MKKTYLIISALLMVCMTSCSFIDATCDFFTGSWGTGLKRDFSETYGKMDSEQLAGMITDPAIMNDKEAGLNLLVELGKRDDIASLPAEEKNNVLNLMVNGSISTDTISSALDQLTGDGNGDPAEIANSILSNVGETDIEAAKQILNDTAHIEDLSPSSASLAAISIIAQVIKSEDLVNKVNDVMTEIQNVMSAGDDSAKEAAFDAAVARLSISDESAESLGIAVKAIGELSRLNAEIMPGLSLGSLLGGTPAP